jgi:hypothetical protein
VKPERGSRRATDLPWRARYSLTSPTAELLKFPEFRPYMLIRAQLFVARCLIAIPAIHAGGFVSRSETTTCSPHAPA